MYRTGKRNFLALPPWKQVGGTTSKPLQPLHLFERMTDFQALHPKKQAIFDGFYTDLEEFRRKKFIFGKSHSIKKKVFLIFHFGKKLCVYALLYDVRAFQKSLLRYAGGIFGARQTDSKGNFPFMVSNAAALVQKNGHSCKTLIFALYESFY